MADKAGCDQGVHRSERMGLEAMPEAWRYVRKDHDHIMKERPILMCGSMVLASLEGRKTQTRRTVKDVDPIEDLTFSNQDGTRHRRVCSGAYGPWVTCPYGQPGDRLWVRETWAPTPGGPATKENGALYRADGHDANWLWKPSIHMPRWASRLTLEIVSVRVERLQDISEEDAKSEGVEVLSQGFKCYLGADCQCGDARMSFMSLWESINGPGSWEKNDWVWVIEFKRL